VTGEVIPIKRALGVAPVPEIPKFIPELCPNCPQAGGRKVGARGNLSAPLVILGESPGAQELRFGAPFVGPSGELLGKCLPEDFDLDRDAFIINAMQCRPPKYSDQNRAKEWKSRACSACHNRVIGQILSHPRKCVLALGGWANAVLTGDHDFKITQRRGEPYPLLIRDEITEEVTDEVIVVPAVHPAFLLRGSGNPISFKADLRLALSLAYPDRVSHADVRSDVEWEDPDVAVMETLPDLRQFWHRLSAQQIYGTIEVACDIETSGFNAYTDYILSIGFYTPLLEDAGFIIPGRNLDDELYRQQVRQIFKMPGIRWIWQAGKFDEEFLIEKGLIDLDAEIVHEDTLLLSYAMSEATRDHDLDEQAKNDLGAPKHKDMLKQWVPKKSDSYAKVPEPILFDYHAKDTKKTYLVWKHKRPQVRADAHLEKLYTQTLIPVSHLLVRIQRYGIHVDWDYVRINREGATQEDLDSGLVIELEPGLEFELEDTLGTLEGVAGWRVNPNSPAEVSKLLYDQFRLVIKGRRPQDTTKETFDKLPNHPAVNLIRRYRSYTKMLSTYVQAIEVRALEDRIHTTFKLHATTTGRLSSSEPNIQNIPRGARWRRMYCARPGYVLIEADYNSAELRMLAVLSQDAFLTGVFLDGKRNLHDEVSIAMYGVNFDIDQRIRAKAINFGIPYGREAFSVAQEFDISGREAQRLIDAWFERAPEAALFLKKCRRAPLQGKTLITVFGRKRRPGVVSSERQHSLQNEFANFHMQSPISDFTLHSALDLIDPLEELGAGIVNLVHDSLLIECPNNPEAIGQVKLMAKTVMEHVPTQWINTPIKFAVDLKVGTHWGLLEKAD